MRGHAHGILDALDEHGLHHHAAIGHRAGDHRHVLRRGEHFALPHARPDQAADIGDALRKDGVVDHKIAELEIFVEAEILRRGAQALDAKLVGELAEGDVAALGKGGHQIDLAMHRASGADDGAALVIPRAGAEELLIEHIGVGLDGRGERDDLERGAGHVEALQTAVQKGGIGDVVALGGAVEQVGGIVVRLGNPGKHFAGPVVDDADRAVLALGEDGGDVGRQFPVDGQLDAGTDALLAGKGRAQAVEERTGDVEERRGIVVFHARAAHAHLVADTLRKGAAARFVGQVLARAVRSGMGQQVAVAVGDVAHVGGGAVGAGVVGVRGPDAALRVDRIAIPGAQSDEEADDERADEAHLAAQFFHSAASSLSSRRSMSRASSSAFIEEMPSRMPKERNVLTRDEPPEETSGSVTPVRGMSLVLPPTMSIVCRPSMATMPKAVSEWKLVRAFIATTRPRMMMSTYTARRQMEKMRPNSSAMAAKMKSE